MVVDLDGFKEVNDIRGHDAGDQVLQSIARRLESVVRGSDTVARVGGDEFVVLSIGTRSEEEAAALVGRLRHALRRPYRVEGGIVEIDASIGWALFPGRRRDAGGAALSRRCPDVRHQARFRGRLGSFAPRLTRCRHRARVRVGAHAGRGDRALPTRARCQERRRFRASRR